MKYGIRSKINLSNKRWFDSEPVHNNEYIKTKISIFNENFHGNRRLIKDEYYGTSILLVESIYEGKNKYHPQTLLEKLFEKSNSVIIYLNK